MRVGGGNYLLIPQSDTGVWKKFAKITGIKEVILEVFKDKMVIRPYKEK